MTTSGARRTVVFDRSNKEDGIFAPRSSFSEFELSATVRSCVLETETRQTDKHTNEHTHDKHQPLMYHRLRRATVIMSLRNGQQLVTKERSH